MGPVIQGPSAASIVLRGHDDNITRVAISQDGRWPVTGSGDKTAGSWHLRLYEFMELVQPVVGRELTAEERKQYELDIFEK